MELPSSVTTWLNMIEPFSNSCDARRSYTSNSRFDSRSRMLMPAPGVTSRTMKKLNGCEHASSMKRLVKASIRVPRFAR